MKFRHLSLVALSVCVVLLFGSAVHAATITWSTAQQISGDSDVVTTGGLVTALNLGASDTTISYVNGVPFTGSSNGNINPMGGYANTFGGGAATPFANLTAGYRQILSDGGEAVTGGPSGTNSVLTLTGLITGNTYLFQWWNNDSRGTSNRYTTATDGANSVALFTNTGGGGGLGQWATGTFVADSSGEQTITFIPIQYNADPILFVGHVSAYQLRNLSVPEPAAVSLMGMALVGLVAVARRRR